MLGVARPLLRQVLEPSNCLVIVERTVSAFDIAVAISRVIKKLTDVKQAVCPFYAPLMVQIVIPLRQARNRGASQCKCNPDVAIARRRRVNALIAPSGPRTESVIADGQNAQP